MKLSILFEPPFWIALLEDKRDGLLYVTRHVFGSEPGSEIVYEFVKSSEYQILVERMTVGLCVKTQKQRINPKRLRRQIQREKERVGISNHSREVMRIQQEENKKEQQLTSKQERAAQHRYQREVAIYKKKQKHRGK
ncbi:MAG: YjdF family protein [Waterburya sp.]